MEQNAKSACTSKVRGEASSSAAAVEKIESSRRLGFRMCRRSGVAARGASAWPKEIVYIRELWERLGKVHRGWCAEVLSARMRISNFTFWTIHSY